MTQPPSLLIIGQSTHDHVVPATPGPWRPQMGGNALYAASGARQCIDPERIGVVTRRGCDYPFDVNAALAAAGVGHICVRDVSCEHLIEWLLYEDDGSRRSLARNASLRRAGGEAASPTSDYLERLTELSPSFDDIPKAWRAADVVYLAPQVAPRHIETARHCTAAGSLVVLDPSPHYARTIGAAELRDLFPSVQALLASESDIRALIDTAGGIEAAAKALHAAGFPEVVVKCGAAGAWVQADGVSAQIAAPPVELVDPTGAGDAFGGAYAASRLSSLDPLQATEAASLVGAQTVTNSGAEQALLRPSVAV